MYHTTRAALIFLTWLRRIAKGEGSSRAKWGCIGTFFLSGTFGLDGEQDLTPWHMSNRGHRIEVVRSKH